MSIEAITSVLYAPPPQGSRNCSANTALRVLLVLADHANTAGAGSCPSQSTIADKLTGLHRRDVQNALALLERQGFIEATAPAVPRKRGTVYRLIYDGLTPTEFTEHSAEESPSETERNSDGQLGRATLTGNPRHEPNPDVSTSTHNPEFSREDQPAEHAEPPTTKCVTHPNAAAVLGDRCARCLLEHPAESEPAEDPDLFVLIPGGSA